jgi:hypothetical protein
MVGKDTCFAQCYKWKNKAVTDQMIESEISEKKKQNPLPMFIAITLLIQSAEVIAKEVHSPRLKTSSRIVNMSFGSAIIGLLVGSKFDYGIFCPPSWIGSIS